MDPVRKWPLLAILAFSILYFLLPRVHAPTVYGLGDDFLLYFPSGSSFSFEHVAHVYQSNFEYVTINVESGLLNGSNGQFRLYLSAGYLLFNSTNATSLSFTTSEDMRVHVNSEPYISGNVNLTVAAINLIEWSSPGWMPINAIMGMVGLATIVSSVTITVYHVKVKKDYMWIVYGIALFAVGYAFTVGGLAG